MRKIFSTKGFTLIEILVAISLLAIISILVWQSMYTTTHIKDRSEKLDEGYRRATLTLSKISQDFSMAVIFQSVDLMGVSASGEQMSKSVFMGKDQGDQDEVTFNSFSHLRYIKNVKESELAEISYYLEADPDRSGSYLLKKREVSPPTANPESGHDSKGSTGHSPGGGTTMTLLDGVKGLNFRYYDFQKADFVDEWDTTKSDYVGKLPRAVEITLTLLPPQDSEEDSDNEDSEKKLVTQVFIESAPGPSDF
ncbi:MAG: prepilin-type N-terminal cleavage/methylation domain-containing protein [Deltaproteobacteria bacterium]|nr:MAG: prepilin-type N-terminal cleavage/methylation domain-containing protein [Deltaproteobacteria bacterium]